VSREGNFFHHLTTRRRGWVIPFAWRTPRPRPADERRACSRRSPFWPCWGFRGRPATALRRRARRVRKDGSRAAANRRGSFGQSDEARITPREPFDGPSGESAIPHIALALRLTFFGVGRGIGQRGLGAAACGHSPALAPLAFHPPGQRRVSANPDLCTCQPTPGQSAGPHP